MLMYLKDELRERMEEHCYEWYLKNENDFNELTGPTPYDYDPSSDEFEELIVKFCETEDDEGYEHFIQYFETLMDEMLDDVLNSTMYNIHEERDIKRTDEATKRWSMGT